MWGKPEKDSREQPRYQNTPVLKDDYFRALKEINPDGFDVFTIQ